MAKPSLSTKQLEEALGVKRVDTLETIEKVKDMS